MSLLFPLAISAAGARGETARQLRATLALKGSSDEVQDAFSAQLRRAREVSDASTTLEIANRLFADDQLDVQPSFSSLAEESYGSPLERVNLGNRAAAAARINSWVNDSTHSHIRELISPDALSGAVLVLANAVYFEGRWLHPFSRGATRPDYFYLSDGSSVRVPTMRLQQEDLGYARVDQVEVLDLPYQDESLSMVFLVPPRGKLGELEKNLTGELLQGYVAALQQQRLAWVTLPRFRVEPNASIPLRTPLAHLGMAIAFSRQADFSGIARRTYIDQVYHRAVVRVDEHGTVAAAATAVTMGYIRADGPPSVLVNRPFLFMIRDHATNALLFLGRLADPRG